MQKFTRSLLAAGVALGLAACGDDVTVTQPQPSTLTGVTVSPSNASVAVGQTVTLSAQPQFSGTGEVPAVTVAWESLNPDIATVDASTGTVTGVAVGAASIRATATGGGRTVTGTGVVNVTNVAPTLLNLEVTPLTVNLGVGGTVQLAINALTSDASVELDTTFTSNNEAIATVSETGLITAVGNGTAVITTTVSSSTNSISRQTTVNVASASISISSITQGNLPVNLAAVAGQIEVTMNINAGNQTLDSVRVLLGGVPAATQVFNQNGAPNAPVTLSINTAAYTVNADSTASPRFLNGATSVTAEVFVSGSTGPSASNTINITLANADTFHAQWLNPLNSAVGQLGPNGVLWYGGPVTLNVIPVFYSGKQASQVTFGFGACGTTTDTAAPFVATFSCAGVQAGNQTATVLAWLYTDNTSGTGVPITSPVVPGTFGFANGPLAPIQVDNVAPINVSLDLSAFPNPDNWFNNQFDWTQPGVTDRGLDSGVGLADASTDVYEYADQQLAFSPFEPNPSNIPEHPSNFTNWAWTAQLTVCDLLGNCTTTPLVGSDLTFGAVPSCDPVNGVPCTFGIDFTPPTIQYTGAGSVSGAAISPFVVATNADSILHNTVANTQGLTSATAQFGVRIRDTRSGFDTINNDYYYRRITRQAPSGTTCALGVLPSCTDSTFIALPVGSDDPTYRRDSVAVYGTNTGQSATSPGYYRYFGYAVDRANNASSIVSKEAAIDVAAPLITGLNPNFTILVGGSQVSWIPIGSDDLEVIQAALYLTYPNMTGGDLRYAGYQYGRPFDGTLATPVGPGQAVGAAGIAVPHGWLNGIDVVQADSTPPAAVTPTYGPTFAGARFYDIKLLEATLSGNSPDSSSLFQAPILPSQLTPGTPFPSLVGQWFVFANGTSGSVIQARAKTLTSLAQPPFPQVAFFRLSGGSWQYLGTVISNPPTNPTVFDQGSDRFWTYTLSGVTPALASGQQIRAVGMSAAGDGLSTLTFTVP